MQQLKEKLSQIQALNQTLALLNSNIYLIITLDLVYLSI